MGGGGQETTTRAEFPPEFRPLAEAAVRQIMALQQGLPLSQFGTPRLTPTAGISPFQQAAMNMLPQTLAPTAGLQSLATLGPSLAGTAQRSLEAGAPTVGANWALQQLAPGLSPMQGATTPVPGPTTFVPQPLGDVQGLTQQLGRPIPTETPALSPIDFPTDTGSTGSNLTALIGQAVQPFIGQAQQQIQQALAALPSGFQTGAYFGPGSPDLGLPNLITPEQYQQSLAFYGPAYMQQYSPLATFTPGGG